MQQLRKHIRLIIGVVLATFLLALTTSAPVRGQAQAVPTTVEVVLHKLAFPNGQMPDATDNDGRTNPFATGTPLNGATFAVYDVTAEFWAHNPTTKAAMARVQDALATSKTAPGPAIKTVTTSDQGTAGFTLPMRSGGQYAVYLFREIGVPAGMTGGQNVVLVLPVKGTTNRIDLYPKNETTFTPLVTGGQRFVKVDADNPAIHLAGAEFVVRNRSGAYLTSKHQWREVSGGVKEQYQQAHLMTMRSDQSGQFAIDGLTEGRYELIEVKAPQNYVRSAAPIPFTVTPGRFSSAVPAIKVVNLHEPDAPHPLLPDTGFFGKIKRHLRRMLPQTGAARATWLSILGGFIILSITISYFATKQRKHEGE